MVDKVPEEEAVGKQKATVLDAVMPIVLEEDLLERLDKLSLEQGVPINTLVRMLLFQALADDPIAQARSRKLLEDWQAFSNIEQAERREQRNLIGNLRTEVKGLRKAVETALSQSWKKVDE